MKTAMFNTETTEELKRRMIGCLEHAEHEDDTGRSVYERLCAPRAQFLSVLSVRNAFSTLCRFSLRTGNGFVTTNHPALLRSTYDSH
jgi:hypothetical protein